MDLLICAAECLDVHVVNGFPEPHRVAINALVDVAGLSRLRRKVWATSGKTTPVVILRGASVSSSLMKSISSSSGCLPRHV